MAVLLPNCELSARARVHPMARDARGSRVATAVPLWSEPRGPYPGAVNQPDLEKGPDGGGWRIRADLDLGPLDKGDKIICDDGREFIVREAKEVRVPGADDVDHIRVLADLDPPARS